MRRKAAGKLVRGLWPQSLDKYTRYRFRQSRGCPCIDVSYMLMGMGDGQQTTQQVNNQDHFF